MIDISKHITYLEAVKTNVPKRNNPNSIQLMAMRNVALKVFEPLREWYGKPIIINSFFRSREVNAFVKGSSTSQHLAGEAIDITAGSKEENEKLFNWIKDNLEWDQLINEYDFTWVHVSLKLNGKNRKQILAIK